MHRIRTSALALTVLAGLLGACRSASPGGLAAADRPVAPATSAPATSPATSVPATSTPATSTPTTTAQGGATNRNGSSIVVAGGEIRINGSVVGGTGAAVAQGTLVGSGIIVTEARQLAGFSALDLAAFGRVDVEIADHESVEVETDDNVVGLVRTEVVGGRLVVTMADGTSLLNATLRVRVRAMALDDVIVHGSSDVEIRGLAASRFGLTMRGSGDAAVSGTVDDLRVDIRGSGDVRAVDLVAQQATVRSSGSGDVALHAVRSLDASVDGSGDVTYRGTPETVRRAVAGSGELEAG
jgi:hypothetical protein